MVFGFIYLSCPGHIFRLVWLDLTKAPLTLVVHFVKFHYFGYSLLKDLYTKYPALSLSKAKGEHIFAPLEELCDQHVLLRLRQLFHIPVWMF